MEGNIRRHTYTTTFWKQAMQLPISIKRHFVNKNKKKETYFKTACSKTKSCSSFHIFVLLKPAYRDKMSSEKSGVPGLSDANFTCHSIFEDEENIFIN